MPNNTTNEGLIESKIRDTTSAAKLKEMKLAILKKEYVRLDEVNKHWAEQAGRVKARLLALPARLSPQLAGLSTKAEVSAVLTGAVNEALNELANSFEV